MAADMMCLAMIELLAQLPGMPLVNAADQAHKHHSVTGVAGWASKLLLHHE